MNNKQHYCEKVKDIETLKISFDYIKKSFEKLENEMEKNFDEIKKMIIEQRQYIDNNFATKKDFWENLKKIEELENFKEEIKNNILNMIFKLLVYWLWIISVLLIAITSLIQFYIWK